MSLSYGHVTDSVSYLEAARIFSWLYICTASSTSGVRDPRSPGNKTKYSCMVSLKLGV